jgi:alpha-methylacyl-CoA racemase
MAETEHKARGPLVGVRVVEVGGVGPAPFCAMLLADLGAEVVRIDRLVPSESGLPVERRFEIIYRSRKSVALDLKKSEAVEAVKRLVEKADILLEGFRPGVMERMGLGPEVCLAINRRLVFGRMTGWGQTGPLARAAGHDINYLALTGALHAIGPAEKPAIPLNLIADFGGGTLYLAMGVLAAYIEAKNSGQGQVVDTAMVDGTTSLMTMIYGVLAAGYWTDERASNRLDSGAPFYNVYETSDGKFVAVGCTEARFYQLLLKVLGLADAGLPPQHDKSGWPSAIAAIAGVFKTRTRDEWCAIFDRHPDACVSPVLSMTEAPTHPHQIARGNFVQRDGVIQPTPAPRFSRTPGDIQRPPAEIGEHTSEVLRDWGFADSELDTLRRARAIA